MAIPGKRILILNWRDTKHSAGGGAEVYNHELAKIWTSQGHHVTIFCSQDHDNLKFEANEGINIIRQGGFVSVYFWAALYYLRHGRTRFDLIIDCQNGVPFFSPLYARVPVICIVHHVHQRVFSKYLPKTSAALAKWLERQAMPWVYRHHRYAAVSQSTKTAMIEELGIASHRIEVVYNGVDHQLNQPGPKSEHPTIVYVGRLKAYKSVDTLLRAFALIAPQLPTAEVVIAGIGDDAPRLKQLAHTLGIWSRVKFTGHVSDKRRVSLMQSAWVVVNPSYTEGWGITTIEAYACGTPVIASDVAGLRESVHAPHAGRLFPYGDAHALADALIALVTDEQLRCQLIAQALDWAGRFDWQTSAQRLLEIASQTEAATAKPHLHSQVTKSVVE